MIFGVFSIRDRLTGYLSPTFEVNEQVAYRNFEHSVLTSDSLLNSHASDYDLMQVGSFDTETGLLAPLPVPKLVVNGQSLFLRSISPSQPESR